MLQSTLISLRHIFCWRTKLIWALKTLSLSSIFVLLTEKQPDVCYIFCYLTLNQKPLKSYTGMKWGCVMLDLKADVLQQSSWSFTEYANSIYELRNSFHYNLLVYLPCFHLSLNVYLKYLWLNNCKGINRRETRICLRFDKMLVQKLTISMLSAEWRLRGDLNRVYFHMREKTTTFKQEFFNIAVNDTDKYNSWKVWGLLYHYINVYGRCINYWGNSLKYVTDQVSLDHHNSSLVGHWFDPYVCIRMSPSLETYIILLLCTHQSIIAFS